MNDASPSSEVTRGLREVEGFLYWQTEEKEARREAASFCDGLPWLDGAERLAVEQRYFSMRMDLAETTARHIAQRHMEIRADFDRAAQELRRRVAYGLTSMIVALFLMSISLLLV
ncbi:hypothetical protein [Streptomyces sp. KL118A]|uniref:hypothetical protein n=1 Tax=Streptomyces sp. KL118A TaxID=3045153 RepID=UPI00278C0CC2|nr:hypothetical protein [Streptomyces sp. KL118A]